MPEEPTVLLNQGDFSATVEPRDARGANTRLGGVGSWSAVLVWAATLVYVCLVTVADPDLWGHTLYGLRAIEQGVLTERLDPFSYTAQAARWINHEWLTEYHYGWLWKSFGNSGLWLWRNFMALTVWAVAGWWAVRRGVSLGALTILFVYAAQCLAGFFVLVRPQLATFALFGVTLVILRDWWNRPRSLWVLTLPFVSAAWVNLHGGYLAGLGIQFIFVVSTVARLLFHRWDSEPIRGKHVLAIGGVFAASLAATLINPYGWEMYAMLWEHLVPKQAVREWQPLLGSWQAPVHYVPFVLLALAFLGSRRWKWIDLIVLAVVGFQALSHMRHVALLCIACMVLLPEALSDALHRMFPRVTKQMTAPGRDWLRHVALGGVLLGIYALRFPVALDAWSHRVPPWQIAVLTTPEATGVPVDAVNWMVRENVQGNLITEYRWGQYVLWHLFPDSRVAFDGRYRTIYPPKLEREYLAFLADASSKRESEPMLDDYPSEVVLLEPDKPACRYLDSREDWARVYQDDMASVYVRRLSRFDSVIRGSQLETDATARVGRMIAFPGGPGGSWPAAILYPSVNGKAP